MDIAIAGAGVMGRNHARVVKEAGHNLAAVIDPDLPAAKATGTAETYPDFTTFMDSCGAEALIVATPTRFHREIAEAALEGGLHVLVEKPIAPTAAEGKLIVEAARKAGRVLSVGHVERYNPVVAAVGDMLVAGTYGDPIVMSSRRVSNLPGRVRDVGCILDIGIHDIDVLNALAGSPPARVFASGGTKNADVRFEDHATIIMEYAGGLRGVVDINWLTPHKVRRLAITCERAFVEADYMAQSVDIHTTNYSSNVAEHHTDHRTLARREPLLRELEDFVSAIEYGRKPETDGESAVHSVATAEAALLSLATGTPTSVAA